MDSLIGIYRPKMKSIVSMQIKTHCTILVPTNENGGHLPNREHRHTAKILLLVQVNWNQKQ